MANNFPKVTQFKTLEEFSAYLKKENIDIPLFVGGAAVDEEFARSIGAFYSPDAMGSVRMALGMCK